jgi:hypothetical protein
MMMLKRLQKLEEDKAKILIISELIDSLNGEQKYNLCPRCHSECGCKNKHHINLHDTGVCSRCGQINELVNCFIANKVIGEGIYLETYLTFGKRLYSNQTATATDQKVYQ